MSADEVDPAAVPDWPHPVVTAAPDGMYIDGQPITLPPGIDVTTPQARQLALQAVASRYAELNRPIKVRAREADGTAWDVVLSPDGSVVPIGDEPVEWGGDGRNRRKRRRRGGARKRSSEDQAEGPDKKRGLVAVGIFAAVVLLLGVVVLNLQGGDDGPAPPKHTPPTTPAAANLPVPPPPDYGVRADWAVPTKQDQENVAVLPGGLIAAVTEHSDLEVRDVYSGVLKWKADLPVGGNSELHVTRIDSRRVLALGGSSSLYYWRLDDRRHKTHEVKYPNSTGGASLTFVGPSPLLLLPNQSAAYFGKGKARLVDVPVGATAVAAQDTSVVAVNADGDMWKLRRDASKPPQPTALSAPAKGAELQRAAVLPNGMFVTAWRYDTERVVILYDSIGGKERGRETTTDDTLDDAPSLGPTTDDNTLMASDDSSAMVIGTMVVFPKAPAAYTVSKLQPISLTTDHVYATDADNNTVSLAAHSRERLSGKDSVPVAVARSFALVTAEKLDKTLLYALPPPPQETKNSTPATPPTANTPSGRPAPPGGG